MKQIVFYSWQSDLPNSTNRGFIQSALEDAAAAIAADKSVAVEPVVDRDTLGTAGAPDIASTIFSKITAADVFVADVSIVSRSESRATPNPNVLIELGYAFKALGHEKVILVFNKAHGKIEDLPFDLRARRVLAYQTADGEPKAPERKLLKKQFEAAIRAALQDANMAGFASRGTEAGSAAPLVRFAAFDSLTTFGMTTAGHLTGLGRKDVSYLLPGSAGTAPAAASDLPKSSRERIGSAAAVRALARQARFASLDMRAGWGLEGWAKIAVAKARRCGCPHLITGPPFGVPGEPEHLQRRSEVAQDHAIERHNRHPVRSCRVT